VVVELVQHGRHEVVHARVDLLARHGSAVSASRGRRTGRTRNTTPAVSADCGDARRRRGGGTRRTTTAGWWGCGCG
jgi:hypothetical protein